MSRFDMSDFEWQIIEPLLPNKRGGVSRVDKCRVLNGIFFKLRTGVAWRDLPFRYGPYPTVYNRFNRWTKAGIWDSLMDAIIDAHNNDVVMIDGTSVRVHHLAVTVKKCWITMYGANFMSPLPKLHSTKRICIDCMELMVKSVTYKSIL